MWVVGEGCRCGDVVGACRYFLAKNSRVAGACLFTINGLLGFSSLSILSNEPTFYSATFIILAHWAIKAYVCAVDIFSNMGLYPRQAHNNVANSNTLNGAILLICGPIGCPPGNTLLAINEMASEIASL